MQQLPFSAEDIYVREMILHGKKDIAIRAAYPRMLPEFYPEAIEYMMQNPDVRRRIDAGIVYFYKEYLQDVTIPDMPELSIREKRELLHEIILRKRKRPVYIRTEEGLRMIMTDVLPEEVSDAVMMEQQLKRMDNSTAA